MEENWQGGSATAQASPKKMLAYDVIQKSKVWLQDASVLRSSTQILGSVFMIIGVLGLISTAAVLLYALLGKIPAPFETKLMLFIAMLYSCIPIVVGQFVKALGGSIAALVESSTIQSKAAVDVTV